MSKDEVDTERARQYAWRLNFSDETSLEDEAEESALQAEPDEAPGAAKTSADQDLDAWRSTIHAKAESLAAAVEQVWNGTMAAEQQAQKVKSLVASAAELGLGMFALSNEPLSLIHLARLVNRHWHRLSAESKQAACGSLIWSRFEPPLAVELLVEICRDGNTELAGALSLPLFRGEPSSESESTFLSTGLAVQLIVLLEAADSLARPWASRLIALDWLRLAPARSAVPVVRRMLRLPHLELRGRALALLSEDYTPPALLPEDGLFLLQDLLVHPPDSGRGHRRFEAAYQYSVLLHAALAKLRPEGGAELLAELAFEGRHRGLRYRGHLAGKWALIALSAAYPEQALPHIDRFMRSASSYVRLVAVEAASELPEEPARPRLIALGADGAASVAEEARDRFIKRFATSCPVEPLAGFPVELLVAPPSESLPGRLLCLRGPSKEARAAMVEVLLAEAPSSEALALLTFALCDDGLLRDKTRPRLPKDLNQMWARLYRRFGGPAIAALCWLVDRYPEPGPHDWLYQISPLVKARKVRKRDLGPLRSLAVHWLELPDPKRQRRALELLAAVGAPAGHLERLLTLAWSDDPSSYLAMAVLKKWPADKTLDARIRKVAQEAWASREVPRLTTALTLGFDRRIPALDRLAEQILAAWQDYAAGQRAQGRRLLDPLPPVELPLSLAIQCVRHLRSQKQLDDSTIKKWLATPEAPTFLLATHQQLERSAATKRALFFALEAPTTPKETAQDAATALIGLGYLHPDDRRVRELIGEATHHLRFWVLHHIAFEKCKNHPAHRLVIAALLKTVSSAEAPDLIDYLPRLAQAVGAQAVKQALTELPDRELRNRLLAIVCAAEPQPEYWQDVSEVPN